MRSFFSDPLAWIFPIALGFIAFSIALLLTLHFIDWLVERHQLKHGQFDPSFHTDELPLEHHKDDDDE